MVLIVKMVVVVLSFKFLVIDEMFVVLGEFFIFEYMVVCFSLLYEIVDELQFVGVVMKQYWRKVVGFVVCWMFELYGYINMDFFVRLFLQVVEVSCFEISLMGIRVGIFLWKVFEEVYCFFFFCCCNL